MKRWYYYALAAVLVAGAVYVYTQSGGSGLGNLFAANSGHGDSPASPARMQWQALDRPGDGFKVDLPAEPKELQAPAYNEAGGSEPVRMMVAIPAGDVTFAVTWGTTRL